MLPQLLLRTCFSSFSYSPLSMYSSAVRWGVISFATIRFICGKPRGFECHAPGKSAPDMSDKTNSCRCCSCFFCCYSSCGGSAINRRINHLVPVHRVVVEHVVQQDALLGREQRVDELRGVELHVREEARHVVERDRVLHAVHHCLKLQACGARRRAYMPITNKAKTERMP